MHTNQAKIYAVYFSPTGGTKAAVDVFSGLLSDMVTEAPAVFSPEGMVCFSTAFLDDTAQNGPAHDADKAGLPSKNIETIDFTLPEAREKHYDFTPENLVVFGMPTYAGKLPNKLLPFVKSGFSGNGARAVALVSFGNRSFDNSLAELLACLTDSGFNVIAAAAVPCRHPFSETLALGRPDEEDFAKLSNFAKRTAELLRCTDVEQVQEIFAGCNDKGPDMTPFHVLSVTEDKGPNSCALYVPGDKDAPYYTPLGLDGKPAAFLKAKPKTDEEKCDKCGLCAGSCPMGSINPDNTSEISGICIKCHACVRRCPRGAKYFDDPAFLSHKAMLERDYTQRAEPVFFIAGGEKYGK